MRSTAPMIQGTHSSRLMPPLAGLHGRDSRRARIPIPRTARIAFWIAAALASLVLLAAQALFASQVFAQQTAEDLLNRVSNPKLQAYEEQLTSRLTTELSRYMGKNQYVLSVKVLWNPEVVPIVQNPQLSQDKQKLPGFPIFVRAPDSPQVEDNAPSFSRMTVRVLLDETLPEYYERFVRKLIPIVARFDSQRGDQVVVVKETFPFLNKDQQPPTLPEKELMDKIGTPAQSNAPGASAAQVPPTASARENAQTAFDESRYPDALKAAQDGFQNAATGQERAQFLAMEGSILFTMNNRDAARASWKRALAFDPTNADVNRMLQFLDTQDGGNAGRGRR